MVAPTVAPRRRRLALALLGSLALAACADRTAGDVTAGAERTAPSAVPPTKPSTASTASTVGPSSTTVVTAVPTTASAAATTAPATTSPPVASTTAPVVPPPSVDAIAGAAVALEPFVDGLPLLTSMASRPDGLVVVTSQTGEVWKVDVAGAVEQVLDLSSEVTAYEPGSERGLLGSAFSPVDGRLFLSLTDVASDSYVVSFAVDAAGRPDPASRVEVLFEDQPDDGYGHRGGGLVFAPDGALYLALGDGGASRGRSAQDYTSVLGGILRIVPRGAAPGYDVPPDNPCLGARTSARSSSPRGCATRGASAVTGARATCGSGTSATRRWRRSTGSRPAPAGRTSAGDRWRGRSSAMPARCPTPSPRCTRTATTRSARP